METVNSFRGYGRMKEMADHEFRQKARKRFAIIIISSLLLVGIIIGATVGVVAHARSRNSSSNSEPTSMASSIKAVCSATQYQDSCYSSITSQAGANTTTDPLEIFRLSLDVIVGELAKVSLFLSNYKIQQQNNHGFIAAALADCDELLGNAMDRVNDSLASLQSVNDDKLLISSKINDLQTWLSAAIADQVTCLDGLEDADVIVQRTVAMAMANVTQYTSNSLAIVAKVLRLVNNVNFDMHRKLLSEPVTGVPTWVSGSSRRVLLQEPRRIMEPNVTVAKDGSGQFRTISEALNQVPDKNEYPFVIYVKEGVYNENVEVGKKKWHVTTYGDGMYKTIVTGGLYKVAGTSTFRTATFAVVGRQFTAIDMGFVNTAGPEKHQAVALRSNSDESIFYRCSFTAFQDTLYAHSLRQYYRDCHIVGTIDFIFGDASVIFQSCTIMPRQPMPGQKNTITAQGRTDPNENTGIVVQASVITPFDNVTADTYLGRPWKYYSTTIIMQSEIGKVVNEQGWLEWFDGVTPPDTITYVEYQNLGPGADVTNRVAWPGYRPSMSRVEANKYGVETFIQGGEWIPVTVVGFDS